MTQQDQNWTFLRGPEYLALPHDPVPWVLQDIIPIGGMVNLYGAAKSHKSFAALQLASAVGDPDVESWLGFKIIKHGPVMYLQIDTPRSAWMDRVNKAQANGYSFDNVFMTDKLIAPYPFNILSPENADWLRRKREEIAPVLVVVDVLREIHSLDENDSTNMKNVISALTGATGDVAVLLVSHSRKEQPMSWGDLMGDQRGSNYIAGRMDSVMKLTEKMLHYSGRSVETKKLEIAHNIDGFVMLREGGDEQRQQLLLKVVREAKGDESDVELADRAIALGVKLSQSRARRVVAQVRQERARQLAVAA